jgi:hypothetical protein
MSAIEDSQTRPIQSETGDDPNLGLFQRLKQDIKDAQRARSKWREEAKRAFKFVASDQWEQEDLQILDEQHRPAITFNRCAPIINAVCGLEVNNRQSIIYLPREQGDVGVDEMVTNTAKWVRDECNAEDEESEAFRDCVICGEGWTETRMDYDEDPKGKIVKERIDPLEMGVNKGASRSNYIDARMVYRVREMDPEDVRAILSLDPNIIDAALDAKWLTDGTTPADGGTGNKRDYPESTRAGVGNSRVNKSSRKSVKVIQCQYWQREPINMVAAENDEVVKEMTDEEFAIYKPRADALGAKYDVARVMKKCYYECFIGQKIISSPRKIDKGMFQFKAMTGSRDSDKKCFYGMMRDMFDPQMWANKWLAQTMHIMNSNAKGGLMAETDAFTNIRKAQRDWSDPTKIVWVKPGSLQKQKVKERQAIALPSGLDALMVFAISSIRDVTGVNLELLGQADREQAASLEAQRRQSAMTVLASLFDSLRKYRKLDGRLLLHFIWLIPEGTLTRIVEKGQIKYVPFVRQSKDIEKYDIIIDQAPNSPDQKQFIWAITAQILQMQILPPAAIIELLKYSPYPESVVAEIRKALGLDGEMPPDQLKQKLDQAEQALQIMEEKLKEAMAQAKTDEDEHAIEMLKIQIDEYKAETERLNAQWTARIKLAGEIATGEREGAGGEGTVTTGEQQLPDIDVGASPQQDGIAELNQKFDQLAQMISQLVQPQQPMEPVPPSDVSQEEPLGEM